MNRRQFVLAGISVLGTGVLAGCGGIGGGGSFSAVTVRGSLSTPSGVSLTDLRVVSLGGVTTPTTVGFAASAAQDAPSMVTVIHEPTGKLVGIAFLDRASTQLSIDATSAAVALIFVALGGNLMPTDGRKPLLDAIKASAATSTLATIVQSQQATDPFALETANSALTSAVATAANAIVTAGFPQVRAAASVVHRDNALPLQLLLQPSSEVDGATVIQSTDFFGYQVQNSKRRVARMHTYLVGHVDANGNQTAVTPLEVGTPLDIPMTNSLLNLNSGWHPVTSSSIPLKLQDGDTKSLYELVYVCPVFGGFDPTYLTLPRYAAEVDKLKQSLQDVHSAELIAVCSGIMLDILGVGGLSAGIAQLTTTINNLAPVSNGLVSLLVGAQQGRLPLAVVSFLRAVLASDALITPKVIASLQPLINRASGQLAADLAAGTAATQVYVAFRAALRVFLAVGAIALVGDLAAVGKDTSLGNRGDLFSATVFQPTIALNPPTQTLSGGNDLVVGVSAPGSAGLKLRYHYKLSGNLVTMGDGSQTGSEFDSTSSTVTIGSTPSTQGDVTLTVTVTDISTGSPVVLATLTGTYHYVVQSSQIIAIPVGTGGAVIGYMTMPLDQTRKTLGTVTAKIAGKGTVQYSYTYPTAAAPIPLSTLATSAQIISIDPNSVQLLEVIDPNFGTNYNYMLYTPVPVNYGNQIEFQIATGAWAQGGTISTQAQAVAALQTRLQAFTVTIKSSLV